MGRPPICSCHCDEPSSSSSSSSSSVSTTPCDSCPDGIADRWELAVAGITNDGCTDCDDRNGTFILNRVLGSSLCAHNSDIEVFCRKSNGTFGDVTGARWILRHNTTDGKWYLAHTGGNDGFPTGFGNADVYWELDENDFDCVGSNEFTLVDSTDACADYPSTLTIVPV